MEFRAGSGPCMSPQVHKAGEHNSIFEACEQQLTALGWMKAKVGRGILDWGWNMTKPAGPLLIDLVRDFSCSCKMTIRAWSHETR